MSEQIRDGIGKGYLAKVDSDNRLVVNAKASSLQHIVSEETEQAYQCIGMATLSAGTVCPLHVKNTSDKLNMVVTYIRHQVIDASGGTDFPNASNYFFVGLSREKVGGGGLVTPINVNAGSGNTADVIATSGTPVLQGTLKEIDRWYTKAEGDMNSFNKEGALILGPNQHIEICYVSDHTSGTVYARISFIMEEPK